MKWPKRFRLASAAATKPKPETGLHLDTVHVVGDRLGAHIGQRLDRPARAGRKRPAVESAIQPLEPGLPGQSCDLTAGRIREHRPT